MKQSTDPFLPIFRILCQALHWYDLLFEVKIEVRIDKNKDNDKDSGSECAYFAALTGLSLSKKEDLVSQRGTITNKRKQHFTSFHRLDQI